MTTGLPKNVREQDRAADEAWRQQYGQDDEPRNPEDEPQDEPSDPAAQPRDPESSDAPAGDDPAPDDKGVDYWKHRLSVLQGKYNAEVRQTAENNRELKAQNERMESRLSELENSLQEARRSQPVDLKQHFSDEELEEFGEDTLKLVYKTADRMAEDKVSKVRDEFQGHVEQVRQTQEQSQAERFWETLEAQVPDWQAINDDPAFHSWLKSSVPVETGQGVEDRTRQSLLEGYEKAGNARQVARLFNTFKEARHGERADPKAEREVPPRRNGTSAQPVPQQNGEIITQQQITDHYSDHQWQRRDPEGWRAREQEIERAVQEGRVK